jgi:hypothetical protein
LSPASQAIVSGTFATLKSREERFALKQEVDEEAKKALFPQNPRLAEGRDFGGHYLEPA